MAIYMWRELWPLCFTANTAWSTVQLTQTWTPTAVSLETSTDLSTWTDYTIWDTITLANIGDKIYFRNKSETDTGFSTGSSNCYKFVMSWSISASWDINYLLNKNSTDTLVSTSCFCYLFRNCTSLTAAPELLATSLTNYCYSLMFYWCTNLLTPPSTLPAVTLTSQCYRSMFEWCTSLTVPPELPATSLASSCYMEMFDWCTSMTKAPHLPATTLVGYCYDSMFYWCTSLAELPTLPATNLLTWCYQNMFSWCSSIKLSTNQTWTYQTPYRIPATWTWTEETYSKSYMFKSTWWDWTWTPSINTTYYTSNTVV